MKNIRKIVFSIFAFLFLLSIIFSMTNKNTVDVYAHYTSAENLGVGVEGNSWVLTKDIYVYDSVWSEEVGAVKWSAGTKVQIVVHPTSGGPYFVNTNSNRIYVCIGKANNLSDAGWFWIEDVKETQEVEYTQTMNHYKWNPNTNAWDYWTTTYATAKQNTTFVPSYTTTPAGYYNYSRDWNSGWTVTGAGTFAVYYYPNSYTQTMNHYKWNPNTNQWDYWTQTTASALYGYNFIPSYTTTPTGYYNHSRDWSSGWTVTGAGTFAVYYYPNTYRQTNNLYYLNPNTNQWVWFASRYSDMLYGTTYYSTTSGMVNGNGVACSPPTGYHWGMWNKNSWVVTGTKNDADGNGHYYANNYTVVYNANGGTGSMGNVTHTYDVAKALTSNAFTRTGYIFAGWNTAANGSGTSFSNGQSVVNLTATNNGTVTVYAQWVPIQYYVKYNGTNATSGSMANSTHTYDVAKNLTENSYIRRFLVTYNANGGSCSISNAYANATFNGWATSSGGSKVYNDKQSVINLTTTNGATINLYATWTNATLSSLPTPTRTGYIFQGWYTAASGGTKITTSTNFTAATTVYAQWVPIQYSIIYHQGIGTDNTKTDNRVFAYDISYNLEANPFSYKETGYYGQELTYNFIGWSLKSFNTLAPSGVNTYKYKVGLIEKYTIGYLEFKEDTSTTSYVNPSIYTTSNIQEKLYFYNYDVIRNLTTTNNATINLYGVWIADNQRPYGGFNFKVFQYNSDGTCTNKLIDDPYDSYNSNDYSDINKTLTTYDDNVYFINNYYRDPEGKNMSVEYQYSIDNGTTWYKLTNNIPTAHQTHLVTNTYSTTSGNLMGITFKANKTTLIRMRVKDEVTYPTYNMYNIVTKTVEPRTLQVALWSTGYQVLNDGNDYDSNNQYLGDRGTQVNQKGSWYTKTLNCVAGNKTPTANLVADELDFTNITSSTTYEQILEEIKNQGFSNFPMYDYTSQNESWGYNDGKLYIFISKDFETKANAKNDSELIKKFFDVNKSQYTYLSATQVVLIKESNDYRYTTFNPEDESIAFLNASIDSDNPSTGNQSFSKYWIAICPNSTTTNVLKLSNDKATTYTNLTTSNASLYTRTYGGKTITGLLFNSYEEMIQAIYSRSNGLFATTNDTSINFYDVYFAVCDKSPNLVSPNKWSSVVKKTLIVEPSLSVYDVTISNETNTNSNGNKHISLIRDKNNNALYHISGYTLLDNKYQNVDSAFDNNTNTTGTMITKATNTNKNYTLNNSSNNSATVNGEIDIKLGYYSIFSFKTRGAETIELYFTDKNNKMVSIIANEQTKQYITNDDNKLIANINREKVGSFYGTNKYTLGIPEQYEINDLSLDVYVSKQPFTNQKTTTRHFKFDNSMFKIDTSILNDIGINQKD